MALLLWHLRRSTFEVQGRSLRDAVAAAQRAKAVQFSEPVPLVVFGALELSLDAQGASAS